MATPSSDKKEAFNRAVRAWEAEGSARNFTAVITSGRDALGVGNEEVAKRVTVAPERIEGWLAGSEKLPHPHIRGLVVTALKKLMQQ